MRLASALHPIPDLYCTYQHTPKINTNSGRYMSVLAKQFKPNKPYIDWLEETLNIVDRLTPDQKNLLTTTEARIYFAILSTNTCYISALA